MSYLSIFRHFWEPFLRARKRTHNPCEDGIEKSVLPDHCFHHSAILKIPNGDPRNGFFYPILTLMVDSYILSVNEKLPVSKFRYFGKYIVQLFGYCYIHVSGQRQSGLER